MSAWLEINCTPEQIALPESKRYDVKALLRAAGANIGMQNWSRFSRHDSPCGVYACFKDLPTVHDFIYNESHAPIYGDTNPKTGFLLISQRQIQLVFEMIGIQNTRSEVASEILIIVHLKSHNHVVVRRVPKGVKAMFGSEQVRNSFLRNIQNLSPPMDELRPGTISDLA